METSKQKHRRQLQELRDRYLGLDTSTATRAQEDQEVASGRAAQDAKLAAVRAVEDEQTIAESAAYLAWSPPPGSPCLNGTERADRVKKKAEQLLYKRRNEDAKIQADRDREDRLIASKRDAQDRARPARTLDGRRAQYDAAVAALNDEFAAKEAARKAYQKQYQKHYRPAYQARKKSATRQTPVSEKAESEEQSESDADPGFEGLQPWDWCW